MLAQDVSRMAYMKTTNVLNRDYYGTPREYVEMARKVMGQIGKAITFSFLLFSSERAYVLQPEGGNHLDPILGS